MRTLKQREMLIALSSIDAVSASVSMGFSDKDVLAARKLVLFGFVTQIVAFGVEGAALQRFTHSEELLCPSTLTYELSHLNFPSILWLYLTFRVIAATLPAPVAHRLTSSLNAIERKSKGSRSMRVKAKSVWTSLPATITTNYWIFFAFVLLHGTTALAVIVEIGSASRSWEKLWTEWGQSATFIVAIVAICHVFYSMFRLFSVKALESRAQIAQDSGKPSNWASPKEHWKTRRPWKALMQRSPFGKLTVDFPDHLLMDETALQKVLNPPLEQDPKLRDILWKELLDGFKWNDPEGILDSLHRGAPNDRVNSDGEYPIHQAARLNDADILVWTHFKSGDSQLGQESLLMHNSLGETPLEVAVNASASNSVRWIMEKLPQNLSESKQAVTRAFQSAIRAEKIEILEILKHLWPDWKILELPGGDVDTALSPFYFSVKHGYGRAVDILVDPADLEGRDATFQATFKLACKLKAVRLVRRTLNTEPNVMSDTKATSCAISSMQAGFLTAAEVLKLLHNIGVHERVVLFQAADHAFHVDADLWELLMQPGAVFDISNLDSVFTFWRPSNIGNLRLPNLGVTRDKESIKQNVCDRGAVNWSGVVRGVRNGDRTKLKLLFSADQDHDQLKRITTIEDKQGRSLLTYALQGFRFIGEKVAKLNVEHGRIWIKTSGIRTLSKCILRCVELGTTVDLQDLQEAFNPYVPIDLFSLLVSKCQGNLSEALQKWYQDLRRWSMASRCYYWRIHILLASGADPTFRDESHQTLRKRLELSWAHSRLRLPKSGYPYVPFPDGPLESELPRRGNSEVTRPIDLRSQKREDRIMLLELLWRWERYSKNPSRGKPAADTQVEEWEKLYNENQRRLTSQASRS
jgi:hypothetical protein